MAQKSTWALDASDGQLVIKTGVSGRAARMGHRLTIALNSWRAEVNWTGDEPSSVDLDIDIGSLEVLRGDGGVTPLSGPEKALARSNALKSLGADRFRTISFRADVVQPSPHGYILTGTLEIHGVSRRQGVELIVDDLGDSWRMACEAQIRQSEFGIKPYSMLIGAMKVSDDVTVTFEAGRAKDG